MLAERNCPICSNKKVEQLIEFDYSNQISVTLPDKAKVVCCENCGLVYNNFKATQKDFDSYYNQDSSYSMDYSIGGAIEGERAHDYDVVLDIVKPHITFDSQILEMGCAKGGLCKFLVEKGYKNIIAIEPSIECVKIAKNNNIDCINGNSFINDESLKNKFDLIILSEVAEHIFDFNLAIENLKTMLKEDGLLYIEVPDANNYYASTGDYTPYFFFNYEHINHFSIESFYNIAATSFLEIIEYRKFMQISHYPSLAVLLSKPKTKKLESVKYYKNPKEKMKEYLKICQEKIKNKQIISLEKTKEELILWGIGSTTTLLLNKMFCNCNIINLIDVNSAKHGKIIKINNKNFKIEAPESITNKNATIVIMPKLYQNEIYNQIKALGYNNKIVML